MKKIIVILTIGLIMTGCSDSPYDKGLQLAQEYDACVSAYNSAYEKVGDDFADKIAGKYQSRSSAVADYINMLDECYHKYQNKWNEIEKKECDARRKLKKASEISDFERGLKTERIHYAFAQEPEFDDVVIPSAVLEQLRTIFPPKPNENQMMSDLVGHSLSEGKTDGYYPQSWKWTISENSISDFEIVSTEDNSTLRYAVLVKMRLSSDTRAYDAKVLISYVLDDVSDWKIEFVQSKGMDIVKTHRYDDCVRCYISRGWLMGALYAENNCEIALEVAGRELNYSGEWVTFSSIIAPHEQKKISNNDTDFIVDYYLQT